MEGSYDIPGRHFHAHIRLDTLYRSVTGLEKKRDRTSRKPHSGLREDRADGSSNTYECGRTHFTWASPGSLRNISATGFHPWPVSPRPYNNKRRSRRVSVNFNGYSNDAGIGGSHERI